MKYLTFNLAEIIPVKLQRVISKEKTFTDKHRFGLS